jgi:transposase
MRAIREILRLRWGLGLSQREVANSVGIAQSAVSNCARRAREAGLSWPIDEDLDDAALEALLYRQLVPANAPRAKPDLEWVHRELRRKGVTLQLLWQEYKAAHPSNGYQYTQFCEHYRRFRDNLDIPMRLDHRAGEKAFVDYSGDGIPIHDPRTGEVTYAELFVAVLGASDYTFATLTPSQDLRCWIDAHIRCFEFFGGVPEITVPDQTRTAVTRPCKYEPEVHETYRDFARHYDTAIIPARPRKPRDKAKAEGAVLIAQRWIVARLRDRRFFSIDPAEEAVREEVFRLNRRPFQKLRSTRRELFEKLDRPALRPLPSRRYEFAQWAHPKVNIDYHIVVDKHYYSVPYQLRGFVVDVRYTQSTVEALHKGKRVASHARSYEPCRHTTIPEHMPKAHREHLDWTPSRLIEWGRKSGEATEKLVSLILESRRHPEQGYRPCLGILRLGEQYGRDRLEAASRRAIDTGACSYRSIKSILKSGLDKVPLPRRETSRKPIEHENIRGPDYYS